MRVFFLSLILLSMISSLSLASSPQENHGLDLLVEAPKWISEDTDANRVIKLDIPNMIPSGLPYASDQKDILAAVQDYRIKHKMVDKKTFIRSPFSDTDLLVLTKSFKGEFLLYLNYTPETPQHAGPWNSLENPLILEVILVQKSNQRVLFTGSYPCEELPDEIIDLGIRKGVHFTRPGDPNARLSPVEAVSNGLRHAKKDLVPFLENLAKK